MYKLIFLILVIFVISSSKKIYVMPILEENIVQTSTNTQSNVNELFAGEWERTNIHSGMPSTITITNVTEEGFDFTVEALYFSHTGYFEAKAKFVEKNKAICNEIDDYGYITETEIEFTLENNILSVPFFDKQISLPLGANVTIAGEYTKEEPVYTNAEDYKLLVPNQVVENRIKELLDYDTYMDFNLTAHDGYINKIELLNENLYSIHMPTMGYLYFYILVTNENMIYIWHPVDNKIWFYSNDRNYMDSEIFNLANQKLNFEDKVFIFNRKENEDNSFSYEINTKINPEISTLIFKVKGYKEEDDYDDDYNYKNEELLIINSDTNEVINKFYLSDYDFFDYISGSVLRIEFIDANFDGYKDIEIHFTPMDYWNSGHFYLLWDKDKNCFVVNNELSLLGLPTFDEEKQLIYSWYRGSAYDRWFYTYKYIDGVLTMIEEISDNYIHFKEGTEEQLNSILDYTQYRFQYYVVTRLNENTFEYEIIEEKFYLYDHNSEEVSKEYDTNSIVGMKLKEIVDWDWMSY